MTHPEPAATVVYTDGSCLGNPGRGGWAWCVPDGPGASGSAAHTTNQRMELTAVLEALEVLADDGPVEVVSDSAYVVNCFLKEWWRGWYRRDWRNAQGRAVANRDLWEPLLTLALDPGRQVTFRWVRGHSGDRWNEVVDQMAVMASVTGTGSVRP